MVSKVPRNANVSTPSPDLTLVEPPAKVSLSKAAIDLKEKTSETVNMVDIRTPSCSAVTQRLAPKINNAGRFPLDKNVIECEVLLLTAM
jgi:hypothetical protein